MFSFWGSVNFAFNPFSGLRPDWGWSRRLWLRAMAGPLIGARLLPDDHSIRRRQFVTDDGQHVTGADLLRQSAAAVPWRRPLASWQALEQLLIWLMVAGAYLSIWAVPLGWGLYFAVGTAHAQTLANAAVAQIAGNDVAATWLRNIFGVTVGNPSMTAVQSGIGALLEGYNTMLFGLTVFVAFYNIAVVVLESAQHGKTGGQRHNMLWAPIRIVVSFGMLAPIAGFNGAQLLLIWQAGEVSRITTNTWRNFSTFLIQGKGTIITPPLNREFEEMLGAALMIETCYASWNQVATISGDAPYVTVAVNRSLAVPWSNAVTGIERSYDGTKALPRGACGVIRFIPPENRPDAGARKMLEAQRDALVQVLPKLQTLGRQIHQYHNTIPAQVPEPTTGQFRQIAGEYAQALSSRVAGAVAAQDVQARQELERDMTTSGWVLAPAWMMTLSRLNQSVLEEAGHGPQVLAPAPEAHWPPEVHKTLQATDLLWHSALTDVGRPHFRSTAIGTSQNALDQLLGKFGFAEVVQGFMLTSTDPLAEMMAFGHRLMNWGLGVFAGAMVITGAAGAASAIPGIGMVGKGMVEMAKFAGPFLTLLVTALIAAGSTLAVVLPWMPAVRWVFGITSWLISLLEAIVGLPLLLVAMMRSDGAGLAGSAGRNAFALLVALALRPMMMLVGLVGGLLIFNSAIQLWNWLFVPYMESIPGGTSQGLIIATMHVGLYTATAYTVANIAFKAIDLLPSHVVRWVGGMAMADYDHTNTPKGAVDKIADTGGGAGQAGLNNVGKGGGDKPQTQRIHEPREVQTQDMIAKAD